jgi:hypothetical protein
MRSQIQCIFILHAGQKCGQRPLQALANQRSYLNLQRLLASRPLSWPEYKYSPVSTHQTQSHLHSQQVNAKSTSNSTRGLPASHSATALRTYDHRAGSPRNGKPTSPVVSQTGAQSFRKEDLQASNKSTSAVRRKRPFSGTTAAGICPCNDSREQWC